MTVYKFVHMCQDVYLKWIYFIIYIQSGLILLCCHMIENE